MIFTLLSKWLEKNASTYPVSLLMKAKTMPSHISNRFLNRNRFSINFHRDFVSAMAFMLFILVRTFLILNRFPAFRFKHRITIMDRCISTTLTINRTVEEAKRAPPDRDIMVQDRVDGTSVKQ